MFPHPCRSASARGLFPLKIFALALVAAMSGLFSDTARAQSTKNPQFIVVFDASGSMWGQIDGVAKIDIAREAFSAAQDTLSGDWQSPVGLIAYGHRRKGDCGDIELIVDPAGGDLGQVSAGVAALTPRGKTPLSESLRLAAKHMRHVEDRATVVLFSDGVETCNADPCAVAAELEEMGLDFTAHVIGFDISAEADRAQLACVAENTGGLYRDAVSAADVARALSEISSSANAPVEDAVDAPEKLTELSITIEEMEGTVRPASISLKATSAETGEARFLGKLVGAAEVIEGLSTNLPEGSWTVEALSSVGYGEMAIVVGAEAARITVPFAAKPAEFSLINNSPYALGVSHYFFLTAETPLQANAEYTVGLVPVGGGASAALDREFRFGSDALGLTVHDFEPPMEAGRYEVIVANGDAILARFPVEYRDNPAPTWKGETRGAPGEELTLNITGNLYYFNEISLLRDGEPVVQTSVDAAASTQGWSITLPEEPGVYDLAYRFRDAEGAKTQVLTQIIVGDVVLPDDSDAVTPVPSDTQQDEGSLVAEPETLFACRQPACLYYGTQINLDAVPLLDGFGVTQEGLNDDGRFLLELVNLSTRELVMLNPPFMVNTLDCTGLTAGGQRAGASGMAADQVCAPADASQATQAQFESLEGWRASANAADFEAGLAEDREAHNAKMSEDATFDTASLAAAWTISTTDGFDVVGVVSFEAPADGATTTRGLLTLYPSQTTGLDEQKTSPIEVNISTSTSGELLGFFASDTDGLNVSLQFARPQGWDGKDNAFQGLAVIGETGKALRVGMF